MSLPLVFHPEARPEVDEAHKWYERRTPGLGNDFLAAVEVVFERIVESPEIHSVLFRGVRRAMVRRFPYGVSYRIHDDRLEVVAIAHHRRDPNVWRSRL